ncbi:MAG: branched-chain amino acid ABC transporter permease [Betaproteobacteria bacterium]|nr:branched-chain amino acid ABC transporter permease [Betaproteobacteria bacterium]
MEFFLVFLINGLSYGLLLFLLCSGLTLIYSLMGVLSFAHASFYLLGAYLAFSLSHSIGFWPALLLAPWLTAACGAALERLALRPVRAQGHLAEMLVTFGVSLVLLELIRLIWGSLPLSYPVPAGLDQARWHLAGVALPTYRLFIMAVSVSVLVALALYLRLSLTGLVVKAALTHPQMVQALGHDVPRVFTGVFALGCGLAGLAGVLGGNAFVTEPGIAATIGSVLFVVIVVGGLGSLTGALLASLLMGCLQTLAVGLDVTLGPLKISQLAPLLPYALMVLVLTLRPRGLMGQRL